MSACLTGFPGSLFTYFDTEIPSRGPSVSQTRNISALRGRLGQSCQLQVTPKCQVGPLEGGLEEGHTCSAIDPLSS